MIKKKKHAPIKQLRLAGKLAVELAKKKGLISEESFINKINADPEAPKLPGIPGYLPHQWTIAASQRMMYDMLIMWKEKQPIEKQENITEFFKFVINVFEKQIIQAKKEIKEMPKTFNKMKDVPILKDVFAPVQKKSTLQALQKFYIDSFAIAVMLKHNDVVSEYAEWFLDWTDNLNSYWLKKEQSDNKI